MGDVISRLAESVPNTVIQGDVNTVFQFVKEFSEGKYCKLFKVVEGTIDVVQVIDALATLGYDLKKVKKFKAGGEAGYDIFFGVGQEKVCDFLVYIKTGDIAYRVAVICMTLS